MPKIKAGTPETITSNTATPVQNKHRGENYPAKDDEGPKQEYLRDHRLSPTRARKRVPAISPVVPAFAAVTAPPMTFPIGNRVVAGAGAIEAHGKRERAQNQEGGDHATGDDKTGAVFAHGVSHLVLVVAKQAVSKPGATVPAMRF